ncbi:4'-phosphopantetheinyl transferase superfamily protein [Luteibacter sp. dw_328]|uniref:4'-phosphopantetheinyl transferase family protein n=1 Tax=Luteibacter sp. dw_328 TaxID=2719796 RepID=UPI001BD56AEF|nr:4'-phosphopantetheinyl transferase superfamily protein [Luteibacter sp. dw_328]
MSPVDPNPATSAHLPLSAERRASGVIGIRPFELGWTDARVPPAILLTYEVDAFDVAAFAQHRIDMSDSIGRSVKKRQAEFFMGRLAARDAVAGVLGAHRHQDGQIGVGESRQPVWPTGMLGSITHAGPYAAAVATASTGINGIGIDIERRIGAETRESVEGTVLTLTEQALLHALAGDVSYEMLLTIAFSAKESFFKGSFATVGTYFDFDAVDLVALDARAGTLELMLTRSLAPALPQGRRFALRTRSIDADTILTSFVW